MLPFLFLLVELQFFFSSQQYPQDLESTKLISFPFTFTTERLRSKNLRLIFNKATCEKDKVCVMHEGD